MLKSLALHTKFSKATNACYFRIMTRLVFVVLILIHAGCNTAKCPTGKSKCAGTGECCATGYNSYTECVGTKCSEKCDWFHTRCGNECCPTKLGAECINSVCTIGPNCLLNQERCDGDGECCGTFGDCIGKECKSSCFGSIRCGETGECCKPGTVDDTTQVCVGKECKVTCTPGKELCKGVGDNMSSGFPGECCDTLNGETCDGYKCLAKCPTGESRCKGVGECCNQSSQSKQCVEHSCEDKCIGVKTRCEWLGKLGECCDQTPSSNERCFGLHCEPKCQEGVNRCNYTGECCDLSPTKSPRQECYQSMCREICPEPRERCGDLCCEIKEECGAIFINGVVLEGTGGCRKRCGYNEIRCPTPLDNGDCCDLSLYDCHQGRCIGIT